MPDVVSQTPLAAAVARSPYSKASIARIVGVRPWTLSRWLNGRLTPEEDQREQLAALLGEKVEVLFPHVEARS